MRVDLRIACRLAMPMVMALAVALLAGTARAEKLDASLREAVQRIAVTADEPIVVTSYRPRGRGPFPWIVLSHGTAATLAANRAIGRNRNPELARQWVHRGYAVFAPIRRGYGDSGGTRLADGYGSCRRPDFRAAGEAAAADLLATVAWAKQQPDIDPMRWLLVGQSAGGFASIYTASKRPEGLRAVLAFSSGRGGKPDVQPGTPCASDQLAALYQSIGAQVAVPVLWFYAENDELFGPRVARLWFDQFRAGGGRGDLVIVPPFSDKRGHGVLSSPASVPVWTPVVADFFARHRIGLPF